MSAPIEKVAELASDEQHEALYDLLVGAASDITTEAPIEDAEREEAA